MVLNEDLAKVIKLLKESQNKNIAARRTLYSNPSAYFEKVLGEDYREELQELFVATPDYISDRVSHIGVWEPKTQTYLPQQKRDWMPQVIEIKNLF